MKNEISQIMLGTNKFLIDRKCVITLLIIALFPSNSNVFAQSAKGIYLTVNDFINNKIEFNTSETCFIKLGVSSFQFFEAFSS